MLSMRDWNWAWAAFMLEIMVAMFPTMVAKIRTPTKKSTTWKRNSESKAGGGVSPIVVRVSVDQYRLKAYFLMGCPNSGSSGSSRAG